MDNNINFIRKRTNSSRPGTKSKDIVVQLPPLNIRTNNEYDAAHNLPSQGSQTVSNKEVFQPVNVGMRSNRVSNSKYSKYSTRIKRGHRSSERFNYWMRKVISSVDKPLVAQNTLGIQSIIIGSHPSRHLEESKEYATEQSNMMNRTRLDPLPPSIMKTEQRLSSTIKQALGDPHDSARSSKTQNKSQLKKADTEQLEDWIQKSVVTNRKDFIQSEKNQREFTEGENQSDEDEDQVLPEYDNKTTQQVADLMHKANTSNRIFIPVKMTDRDDANQAESVYTEDLEPPMDHEGTVVFSKQGFIKVGKGRHQPSEYISHDNFILNGINRQIFANLPLFKKFKILKVFKQWKCNANYSRYIRKRERLCKSFIPSKPQFAEGFAMITWAINEIKNLKFLEIKRNTVFGRKQQNLVEKCEKVDMVTNQATLKAILYRIKNVLDQIKTSIQKADLQLDNERRKAQELSILKKSKYDEHIIFAQAKKRLELEGEKLKIAQIRHKMFDSLIQYVNRYVVCNLTEVLYENKRVFSEIFLDSSCAPQFELSV